MTVMDPRPWSPTGPHIGPDEEDLLLLQPTGDPEADLGSAVLAVHRVGAAACEVVARAPLPDEYRLIDALATARAAAAAPVVEAVSKCVSSENARGYADLLLRDLFDAGETGALAVYRACVSKGVAPPLAAQRAGLVYGVPHDELGRYMAVAAEPRSHPIAIADAADRAVARWASGVVREEMTESVAKAVTETVAEYNQTVFGREHPKDTRGRFAETAVAERTDAPARGVVAGQPVGFLARLRRETGVGGQAAPEVAGAPVTVAVQEPVRPVARVQRSQREQRTQRVAGAQAAATVQTSVRSALKSRVTALVPAQVKAAMQAQREKPANIEDLEEVTFDPETTEAFGTIPDIPLAWAMPVNVANQLYEQMGGGGTEENPKHVQMGNLQTRLAEPMRWEHSDHTETMQTIAEESALDERPRAIKLSRADLERAGVSVWTGTPEEIARRVDQYAQMTGVKAQLGREPTGEMNPLVEQLVSVVPSAVPGSGDWYAVRPAIAETYSRQVAVQPMAAEFVIAGDYVRGNIEGGPDARQPYFELDPSQHYVVYPPRQVWKETGEETGYFIDRYTVTPMEEWREDAEFGKAVATEQAWRTEPRNAQGEWTRRGFLARLAEPEPPSVEVVTPVVTPIAPTRRGQRVQRGQRSQRVAAPAQSSVSAPVQAKLVVPLNARLQTELKAALDARVTEEEEPVQRYGFPMALDDRPRHVLMNMHRWDQMHMRHLPGRFVDDVTDIDLDLMASTELASMRYRTGDEVDARLRRNIVTHMTRPEVREREITALARQIPPNDPRAWEDLLDDIDSYMKGHQDVAYVRVGGVADDARAVKVYANHDPVPDQVLIYMPEDYNPELPIRLKWLGKARRDELTQGRWREHDPSVIVDAPVAAWRAEQRIWRAEQSARDER